MNDDQLELTGAWVQAIGTVTAAIGASPIKSVSNDFLEDLGLIGNELQATGNAILAGTADEGSLEQLGNAVQASGNVIEVGGYILPVEEETQNDLFNAGNIIQAVGGSVALSALFDGTPEVDDLYDLYGNILQIIGNSLQAIGGNQRLSEQESFQLNFVGSWIQATGSVISAIGVSREILKDNKNKDEPNTSYPSPN